jgi:hypothetical protein
MEYFLELTEHEGEFYVHHDKLIEYGVMSSVRSSAVKVKLDALGLVENEDYSELQDVLQLRPQGGTSTKKVYILTPEAFKTCLLRARRYPNQTVDSKIYSKYYLLLEKTYKLYTDYEKQLLFKQLEQKDHQIEQKDHQIEQKDHQLVQTYHQLEQKDHQLEQQTQQLIEERDYRLSLENSFLHDNTHLQKNQIIYIATSYAYSKQNRFKVGGTSTIESMEGRLSNYNTGRAIGDEMFFVEWYTVCCYKDIEKRLDTLIGKFRDKKSKEIYIMHYTNLKYIVEYIVNHYDEEVAEINTKLEQFIKNLDIRTLKPSVVHPKHLNRVHIQIAGNPDVVIETNVKTEFIKRLEEYVQTMDQNIKAVRVKDVLDKLEVKKGRRAAYPILIDVLGRLLPNTKIELRSSK